MNKTIAIAAVTALVPLAAVADRIGSDPLLRSQALQQRRDARLAVGTTDGRLAATAAEARKPWTLVVGAAYTDGDDGSKTSDAPFDLSYALNDRTTLDVAGGWSRSRAEGITTSGWADVTLSATYAVSGSGATGLVVGAGVTVPTAGEVGSTSASQQLLARYGFSLTKQWGAALIGTVGRSNAEPDEGASRITWGGAAQAVHVIDSSTDVALRSRQYRQGAGGSTSIVAVTDFPLWGSIGGTLSYGNGLTSGKRDKSLEFDLTFQF